MNEITIIGLDIAKNVFHCVGLGVEGALVFKRELRRNQVLKFFNKLQPCTVALESCASAQYWAREIQGLGHTVRMIPAQHVKPYLLGSKNDFNDARAIAEACTRPGLKFVAPKSQSQQDLQSIHRLRAMSVKARTAHCNMMRGLLGEYGISIPKGIAALRKQVIALLDRADESLSEPMLTALCQWQSHLQELSEQIDCYTDQLGKLHQAHEPSKRLQSIPGFGVIVSTAFYSAIGDATHFKRGREVSAVLGLVPGQHSSGGKQRLLGITKRGNGYIRKLLVEGARAVVHRCQGKEDSLSRWLQRLIKARGIHKAVVAYANKMARMGWAILNQQTTYIAPSAAA